MDFIRDKKLPELDEELYFAIEEKNNVVDLTDKGRHFLAPNDPEMFVLPDLSQFEEESDLDEAEKNKRRTALEKEFSDKGEKIQNVQPTASCVLSI